MQSNGYDHWTREELRSSVGSDSASLSGTGQVTSSPLCRLCPNLYLALVFPCHVFAKHSMRLSPASASDRGHSWTSELLAGVDALSHPAPDGPSG